MKKLLPVPYLPQTTSITCALACLSMVLRYYEKDVSESEISKTVQPMKGGKEYHLADMGRVALSVGCAAQLYCYDFSNIFTKDHMGLSQQVLKKKFGEWARSSKVHYRLPYLRFMEAGGTLHVQPVREDQLVTWIDENIPPMLLVECQPFYHLHKRGDCGHAIVLIGYDNEHFYLHDPLMNASHAKGEAAKIRREELLFSLYRRYGNTLVIRRRTA